MQRIGTFILIIFCAFLLYQKKNYLGTRQKTKNHNLTYTNNINYRKYQKKLSFSQQKEPQYPSVDYKPIAPSIAQSLALCRELSITSAHSEEGPYLPDFLKFGEIVYEYEKNLNNTENPDRNKIKEAYDFFASCSEDSNLLDAFRSLCVRELLHKKTPPIFFDRESEEKLIHTIPSYILDLAEQSPLSSS